MAAHATTTESAPVAAQAPALRILSLGGGRQSSTLLYLALEGELPAPDAVIFADTRREPSAVMAHIAYLRELVGNRFAFVTVSVGDIRADAFDSSRRFASMPLYVRLPNGEVGQLLRQCTAEYKLRPIAPEIRRLLGIAPGRRVPKGVRVERWIGFSLDEVTRIKPSRYPWIDKLSLLVGRTRRICAARGAIRDGAGASSTGPAPRAWTVSARSASQRWGDFSWSGRADRDRAKDGHAPTRRAVATHRVDAAQPWAGDQRGIAR